MDFGRWQDGGGVDGYEGSLLILKKGDLKLLESEFEQWITIEVCESNEDN